MLDENIKQYGDLAINYNLFDAYKHGHPCNLTAKEFNLLVYLIENEGKVMSREQIISQVFEYDFIGNVRVVDVTIRRLREKIEDDPSNSKYIITKRYRGYRFTQGE